MLTELAIASLLQTCAPDIGASTLRGIIQVESGGNPWTINSNTAKKSFRYQSQEELARAAESMVRAGHNIDIGLAQINSRNLPHLGLSPRQVAEPCTNLRASATLLKSKYAAAWALHHAKGEAQVLRHALSRYNTGNDYSGLKNGYVDKVIAAAMRLTGRAGQPTPRSSNPYRPPAQPSYAQPAPAWSLAASSAPVYAPTGVVWTREPVPQSPTGSGVVSVGSAFR